MCRKLCMIKYYERNARMGAGLKNHTDALIFQLRVCRFGMEVKMKERILYEDKEILICHKPAGIATQTGRVGQKDMVSELKNYLGGNSYLGLVHRLDQPVEGLLVFAKTPFAAKELSRQLTADLLNKQYLAVVLGEGFPNTETLRDYLIKDNKTNTSRVAKAEEAGAKKAKLQVKTAAYCKEEDIALLEIRLVTGRHHQIRVQLTNAGFPLLGDSKYGTEESKRRSKETGVDNVALCACRLEFLHPKTKKKLEFEIKPEGKIFQTGPDGWEPMWKN